MNYETKDFIKFSICTHLQSYGCIGSSSYKYHHQNTFEKDVSLHTITHSSIVGISTNGNRRNRVVFPVEVLHYLLSTQCKIVTDSKYHTERNYNIGEREVSDWLLKYGYVPEYSTERTLWNPPNYVKPNQYQTLINSL